MGRHGKSAVAGWHVTWKLCLIPEHCFENSGIFSIYWFCNPEDWKIFYAYPWGEKSKFNLTQQLLKTVRIKIYWKWIKVVNLTFVYQWKMWILLCRFNRLFFTNLHCCLNGNDISNFFCVSPPHIEDYLPYCLYFLYSC